MSSSSKKTLANSEEWEHKFDNQRFSELMKWLTAIDQECEIGAFWFNNGAGKDDLLSMWLARHHNDPRRMMVTIPSECGTSELLYRLLRAIQANTERSVDLTNLMYLSMEKRMELRYGAIPFPWPRDASERRQLLERIYQEDEGFWQIKFILDDAENLLPKALKEIIYLNKTLSCPFILMGSEDLNDLVKGARSDRIRVFPQSGGIFDPEFMAQAKQHFLPDSD